jgi:hypothetical protein
MCRRYPIPTLYEPLQKRKMIAKTGRFRELGKAYKANIWRARMARTTASERFFGWRGSSNWETISWVCGTVKTAG